MGISKMDYLYINHLYDEPWDFMRKTPYIPKFLLSPMYIGIGSALFIASFRYYLFLFKKKTLKMPKVERNTLILITGIIWLTASIMLIRRAYGWLDILTKNQVMIGTLISLPFAIIKSYFIFHKLNAKILLEFNHLKQ